MNAMSPPPGRRSLPVGPTAAAAWRLVRDSRDELLRIGALPLLLTFVLSLVLKAWPGGPMFFLVVILDWVPITLFAVAWLRFLLLRGDAGSRGVTTAWTARETKFLSRVLLLNLGTGAGTGLCAGLIAVALGIELEENSRAFLLVAAAAGLVAAYVVLRLSLVLPAIAIGRAYGLRDAWRDSAACGLQLLAIMMLTNLPAVLLLLLLNGTGLTAALPFTMLLATAALGYIVFAVTMTVLALAFRACAGPPGQPLSLVSS